MNPLFVFGILDSLGFGEKILVAGVFVLVMLYLWRLKGVAGRSTNAAASVWMIGISLSAAAALAVLLGWVDPSPGRFVTDVVSWGQAAIEFVFGPVDDFIAELLP